MAYLLLFLLLLSGNALKNENSGRSLMQKRRDYYEPEEIVEQVHNTRQESRVLPLDTRNNVIFARVNLLRLHGTNDVAKEEISNEPPSRELQSKQLLAEDLSCKELSSGENNISIKKPDSNKDFLEGENKNDAKKTKIDSKNYSKVINVSKNSSKNDINVIVNVNVDVNVLLLAKKRNQPSTRDRFIKWINKIEKPIKTHDAENLSGFLKIMSRKKMNATSQILIEKTLKSNNSSENKTMSTIMTSFTTSLVDVASSGIDVKPTAAIHSDRKSATARLENELNFVTFTPRFSTSFPKLMTVISSTTQDTINSALTVHQNTRTVISTKLETKTTSMQRMMASRRHNITTAYNSSVSKLVIKPTQVLSPTESRVMSTPRLATKSWSVLAQVNSTLSGKSELKTTKKQYWEPIELNASSKIKISKSIYSSDIYSKKLKTVQATRISDQISEISTQPPLTINATVLSPTDGSSLENTTLIVSFKHLIPAQTLCFDKQSSSNIIRPKYVISRSKIVRLQTNSSQVVDSMDKIAPKKSVSFKNNSNGKNYSTDSREKSLIKTANDTNNKKKSIDQVLSDTNLELIKSINKVSEITKNTKAKAESSRGKDILLSAVTDDKGTTKYVIFRNNRRRTVAKQELRHRKTVIHGFWFG